MAVAPKGPRESVQTTKDIREAVQNELAYDPLVDAASCAWRIAADAPDAPHVRIWPT